MRSFLGVKALRKYPHAVTAQPLAYPLMIKPPAHKAEGVKKKGTAVAPGSVTVRAAAGDGSGSYDNH